MGVDVVADVAPQRLVGVAVGGDLGDDLLGRLVGQVIQALLERLSQRGDRGIRCHRPRPLLAADCTRHTTGAGQLRALDPMR